MSEEPSAPLADELRQYIKDDLDRCELAESESDNLKGVHIQAKMLWDYFIGYGIIDRIAAFERENAELREAFKMTSLMLGDAVRNPPPEAQEATRWRKTSEMDKDYPPAFEDVLVYSLDVADPWIAFLDDDTGLWMSEMGCGHRHECEEAVTHWMPLPAPPEAT